MLAPSSGLLRAGLALKLNQIKLATRSYLRDRTNQATTTVTSYATAAGLFAAAGIFLIAACLVGLTALFRWIEINYGLFWAFGVVGALLLVIAAICAALAAQKLKPAKPHFPSLTSRLRVAIKANPIKSDQIEAARDTAAAILSAPSSPAPRGQPAAERKTSAARQQGRARRPDPDGDIIGLGGRETTAAGATNGRLMSGRRSLPSDNLLLIAATAILVLAAQRYLQASRPRKPHPDPSNSSVAQGGPFAREMAQPGHGRSSSNPLQIPWAGWKDILWRTYLRTGEDRLLATAAGVVFFGLLAVFPAITALVSSYGLFADAATIGANLQTLSLMLPEGSFQIVQDQIGRVLDKGSTSLGATFLFGLALAILSANAGMKAVIDALNVVYEEPEKRSFVRLNLLSLAFTSGGIAALLLMVGAVVAVPLALDHVGLAPQSQFIVSLARWPLLFVILLAALGILYRFGPSRRAARWEWLSAGTLVAALLWIGGSALLSWYLSNFGNYSATYGSLGAAIGLMMWMWMSAIIVLCGAELNSEIEHQTAMDTTVGPPRPLGARRAVMADTLGPAVPAVSKEH